MRPASGSARSIATSPPAKRSWRPSTPPNSTTSPPARPALLDRAPARSSRCAPGPDRYAAFVRDQTRHGRHTARRLGLGPHRRQPATRERITSAIATILAKGADTGSLRARTSIPTTSRRCSLASFSPRRPSMHPSRPAASSTCSSTPYSPIQAASGGAGQPEGSFRVPDTPTPEQPSSPKPATAATNRSWSGCGKAARHPYSSPKGCQ